MVALDFEAIKGYYGRGLWPIRAVWDAVDKVITEDGYFQITGFVFPARE